jgi:hypothetical protein
LIIQTLHHNAARKFDEERQLRLTMERSKQQTQRELDLLIQEHARVLAELQKNVR